jgi:hypothetical protein
MRLDEQMKYHGGKENKVHEEMIAKVKRGAKFKEEKRENEKENLKEEVDSEEKEEKKIRSKEMEEKL